MVRYASSPPLPLPQNTSVSFISCFSTISSFIHSFIHLSFVSIGLVHFVVVIVVHLRKVSLFPLLVGRGGIYQSGSGCRKASLSSSFMLLLKVSKMDICKQRRNQPTNSRQSLPMTSSRFLNPNFTRTNRLSSSNPVQEPILLVLFPSNNPPLSPLGPHALNPARLVRGGGGTRYPRLMYLPLPPPTHLFSWLLEEAPSVHPPEIQNNLSSVEHLEVHKSSFVFPMAHAPGKHTKTGTKKNKEKNISMRCKETRVYTNSETTSTTSSSFKEFPSRPLVRCLQVLVFIIIVWYIIFFKKKIIIKSGFQKVSLLGMREEPILPKRRGK
ncbi:hypothetical protein BKA57DRAFT_111024 [Linnemannia elongata]|nr:hypothetical protein BKA57DRAFT_111024 [Linnemannia elongata]